MKDDNVKWRPGDTAWAAMLSDRPKKVVIGKVRMEDAGDGQRTVGLDIYEAGFKDSWYCVGLEDVMRTEEEAAIMINLRNIKNMEYHISRLKKENEELAKTAAPAKAGRKKRKPMSAEARAKRAAYMKAYWKEYRRKRK